ncbi:unnamed protein product [Soboliphyme baturini]|uniref:G_PROTEIN_RECEP_F1_2 domain-containing protein n=1 Tax=Soboliphyme baturini TaxID=241478 RepID=A0A183I943_9BILA|nr:unnamed protein product [Soboliphyme baturini]
MKSTKVPWLEEWRFPSSNRSASVLNVIRIISVETSTIEQLWDPDSSGGQSRSLLDEKTYRSAEAERQGSLNDISEVTDASGSILLLSFFGLPVTPEKMIYVSVILLVTILLILTSLLTITVIATSESQRNIIGYYMTSLAISDLLCGTLVTPVSIYGALDESWKADLKSAVCKFETYTELVLIGSVVYIFMWIGVDRHIALARPTRYEVEQTFTRCKCWIIFSWVTSALLCCPILFSDMPSHFIETTFLCSLDWSEMMPYTIAIGMLVFVPSFVCITYTYSYIFSNLRHPENLEDSQKTQLENDHSFITTFFVIISFTISWLPVLSLRAYEVFIQFKVQLPNLHFSLMWLAIASGAWKLFIYCMMSKDFKSSLCRILIRPWCPGYATRSDAERCLESGY